MAQFVWVIDWPVQTEAVIRRPAHYSTLHLTNKIMTRSKADSSILAETLRQKIRQFDPDLPVMEMQSMSDVITDSMWLKRLSATLIGVVALLAMMLAASGIYSVMSYSVSQRRKEGSGDSRRLRR